MKELIKNIIYLAIYTILLVLFKTNIINILKKFITIEDAVVTDYSLFIISVLATISVSLVYLMMDFLSKPLVIKPIIVSVNAFDDRTGEKYTEMHLNENTRKNKVVFHIECKLIENSFWSKQWVLKSILKCLNPELNIHFLQESNYIIVQPECIDDQFFNMNDTNIYRVPLKNIILALSEGTGIEKKISNKCEINSNRECQSGCDMNFHINAEIVDFENEKWIYKNILKLFCKVEHKPFEIKYYWNRV